MRKYIFWLVLLAAAEISLSLYLTFWREAFWNAVSNKEQLHFMQQLGVFTVVALCACFVSGFSGYLVSLTAIKWREKLNNKAQQRMLSKTYKSIENVNQRIQEDCMSYPDLILNLAFGTIKALFYILVFSISLAASFSWVYLAILLGYTLAGTIITKRIATPLIQLNYEQQRVEATYRNSLCVENFVKCVHVMLGLAKKQKHLTYFQQFYLQIGVVIPLIIIAPAYFSTAMTLGMLMRFNSLSSTILDNMSYGITSFASINKLISCRKRLLEAKIL